MKRYIIKLKRTFAFHELKNNLIYLVVALVILLFTYQEASILLFFILFFYLLFLLIKYRTIFFITLIIILIIIGNIISRTLIFNTSNELTIKNQEYHIIEIKENLESYQILLKKGFHKALVYTNKEERYRVGNIVLINGKIKKADTERIPNGFNYYRYLKYQGISGIIECNEELKITGFKFNIYTINDLVNNYFSNNFLDPVKGYLKALVIGNKNDLSADNYQNIQQIGIGHLFVISGLHMGIIIVILEKIFKVLKIPLKYHFSLTITCLSIYYLCTAFMISIFRVLCAYILKHLNIKYRLHFSKLDLGCLNIVFVLVINPFQLFSYSFLLSYIIYITLIIINPLLLKNKQVKSYLINNLIISSVSIIITMPVVIAINPTINLLSILYNICYIPFVSNILLPLSIITSIFPFLSNFYNLVINLFNYTITFCSKITFAYVTFPKPPNIMIIIYYLIVIKILLLIKRKSQFKLVKIIVLKLVILLFIWNNLCYFRLTSNIYFLDLPIGESTFIVQPHNRANILIDTGESGYNDLIIFLKKQGIKRLDYLIITHSDSDHMGLLINLAKEFTIKNIILSIFDDKTLQICQSLKNKKIKIHLFKQGDYLFFQGIRFECLWPKDDSGNSNENSLVFNVSINNLSILLTGDIGSLSESQIIFDYPNLNVDILKIAHHGSKYSTSFVFLKAINYHVAISMNGNRNRFNFPDQTIVNRIAHKPHFMTIKDYTVILTKRSNQATYQISKLKKVKKK